MKHRKRTQVSLLAVELVRIGFPFLIFFYPLLAFILNLIFDSLDAHMFYELRYPWTVYNTIDKLLDYWWYIFILLFFWENPLFPIAAILFLYRTIGQIGGVVTKNENVYLYFPNILQWFFLFVLLLPRTHISGVFLLSTAVALFNEWIVHISHISIYPHNYHKKVKR